MDTRTTYCTPLLPVPVLTSAALEPPRMDSALFYLIESHETIGVHPGAGFVGVTLATVAMPCALLVGHVACTRAQAALDAPG